MAIQNSIRLAAILSAFVLAATLAAPSAWAQGLKGKTIKASYSFTSGACRPSINKCEEKPGGAANANIYISSKGRIFDYATGQTGDERASGQWASSANGQYRWTLRGNSIVFESDHSLSRQFVTYTMTGGGGCSITVNTKSKHPELIFTTRISVQSCIVADGLVER